MKLYKISQEVNNNWDTYDSAIVLANSEFEARRMHPSGDWRFNHTWTDNLDNVTVELLGEADPSLGNKPEIILASFNAG